MSWSMDRTAAVEVPLRWRDLDHQGHVYHATVLTLLDEARTSWLRNQIGVDSPDSYVVARIEIDYADEIRIEDGSIRVEFSVARIGRTSFTLSEKIVASDGAAIVSAVVTAVLWDRKLRRPRAIEPAERERLEACLVEQEAADA